MLAGILAGVLAFSGLGVLVGPPAAADTVDNGYTHTFLVNDARDVADAAPGDGECATRFTVDTPAVPSCTLYAAIQEANALPADASVLIAVAPSIRNVDGSLTPSALIQLNWNTTNNPAPQVSNMATNMRTASGVSAVIGGDSASRYWVQHDDVTIDLQGRLGWTITSDVGPNVLLFTGANQTLRNFTTLTSAESGIYVGSTAVNFSLVNGRLANSTSFPGAPSDRAIERGVVVVEGAKNTTITNVHFQRAYWDSVLLAPAGDTSLVVDGLTVDQSSWDQPANGGGYDPIYNYFVRNWSSAVSGRNIVITNNDVRGWGTDGGSSNVIYFSGGTWNDVSIIGNRFTSTTTQAINPIAFSGIGQTNAVVRDNDFIQETGTRANATSSSWVRNNGTTNGVRVFDNRFEGGNNQVQLANVSSSASTSVLPMYRNTMSGVSSAVTSANENVVGTTNNIYNSGNGTIRTAYPMTASAPPLSCEIDVAIAPPSTTGGSVIPTDPIFVDAYVGRNTAAGGDGVGLEQYLGRVTTTQSALPASFRFPFTGAADSSVVRLQTTEIATGKTSAYSRTIPATGPDTCAPQSWIKQGGWYNDAGTITSTQEDPTSFRDVRFQIRTSEPLGGAGLTSSSIAFTGTAPGAQVVSLTKLSDTTWDLVAKANGTGTIVPVIQQGAIQDLSGQASIGASNTTRAPVDFAGAVDVDQTLGIDGADIDDSVLYNSPLAISAPEPIQLAIGEPGERAQNITVSNTQVDANGRVTKAPSSPVTFTQQWSGLVADPGLPDPGQSADGIAVALPTHTTIDDTQPTMDTIDRSVTIPVRAIDNQVVDGTRHVTLGLAVSSDDPEFDGLELPTIPVTVTDDDHPDASASSLVVTANGAYADGSSPNTVVATVHNAAGQPVSNATVLMEVPDGTTWVGPDGVPGTPDDVAGSGGTVALLSDSSGEAKLHLVSSVVGSYQVAAQVNGSEDITGSPQTVDFVRVTVDPSAPGSAYTVSTGPVVADGSATHTITVTLVDVSGNPATGWESALAATAAPASGVVVGSFAPTSTPGEYTATVTSTSAGSKAIAVAVDDGSAHPLAVAGGGSADAVFVAGPPAVGAGLSTVSIDDASDRVADGSAFHRVTVVLADAQGNPVTGEAARLQSSVAGNASGAVTVTSFTETATPGTYEALVRSTAAGGQQVTVTFDAAPAIGTVVAAFAAGGVDLGNSGSSFSVSTGDAVVSSGHHSITVMLADANGNPVSGQAADLSATSHATLGGGGITGFVETATAGTYQATVTSTVAGSRTIDVRFGGTAVTVAGNGAAAFVAAAVDLGDASSRFSVSEGEVAVGSRSHGITVTLADQYGNPVSGEADQLLATTTDDIGGGAITAFEETSTPGTYLASITSTVAGGKAVSVALGGNAVTLDGNDVANFAAGGVDPDNVGTRFVVSSGDQTVGTGSHTVTVTLADGSGNPVSGQAAGIEASTADDLGTGSITAFAETATPGTYTATITSSVAGDKAVTAVFGADRLTVLLVGNDTASFVSAGADLGAGASGYAVSTGSRPVGTGQHTITVTLVDAFGNPVPAQAGELTASTTDSIGAGVVSAFSEVAPGSYQASVSSTVAGSVGIAVDLAGSAVPLDGNGTAHFAAGGVDLAAGGTVFSVSEGDASVSGGSHAVTVTLTDEYGNPVTAEAPRLGAGTADELGSGVVGPFVETTPGTYVASITSSVAGQKTVQASFDGQQVSIGGNGNDLARFIAGGVDTGNAGTAFSVSTGDEVVGTGAHTITVTLLDADGNPVSGQADGLIATASDIGSGSVSAFTETAASGTYSATVSSTVAGSARVTVEFGGAEVRANGNVDAVFVAGAVDPSAAGSGYTVSGGDVAVDGGAHTVTVTLTDTFGNPASGAAAQLTAQTTASLGAGVVTGFTESATPGEYTATITSTVAGSKPVTADFAGTALALTGNGTAVFIAGGVDTTNIGTSFSVTTGDQVVGTGAHTITASLVDSSGNPVSGQAAGLSASSVQTLGAGSVTAFAETATPGTYTASITSTIARGKTVEVAFGGSAIVADGNAVAHFIAGPIDLAVDTTGYVVSTGVQSVDGGSHEVHAYLTDSYGNSVSGYGAALNAVTSDALGTGGITGFAETAIAGEYVATITSSIAGDKAVDAFLGATALNQVGNTVAQFGAGDVDLAAGSSAFTVSAGDSPVGGTGHTVTVTLADTSGNPVPAAADQLTATTSADLGAGGISAFTETAPGTYEATVTSTLSGDKPVDVHYGIDDPDGVSGPVALADAGNRVAHFVAGQVDLGDPASSVAVSTGDAVVVADTHTVTVTLADQYGNPVSGQEAELIASTADDLGTGTISAFVETSTAGTYTATVASSVAGDKTIVVAFSGSPVTADANTVATFVAGDADTANAGTAFAVSTGDQAVGTGSHTITVTLADAHGNPVAGQASALVAATTDDLGTGSISSFTETGTSGTYTATVTSTSAGAKQLTVSVGGSPVSASANAVASFTADDVDLTDAGSAFSVSAGEKPVGTGIHSVTVMLADRFGNPVSGQASALVAATTDTLGSGAVSAFTETGTAGTYIATVTSTVAGDKAITVALNGDEVSLSGNGTAAFASTGVDLGNAGSGFAVTTGSASVDGGSHTITATLVDAFGNPVSGQAAGLAASSADLGSGIVTGFAETATPGTYTATVTSTVAGAQPITVTLDGNAVSATGNADALFVAGSVDLTNQGSSYTVTEGAVPVDGGSHLVTIRLADRYGNPVPNQAGQLAAATPDALGTGSIAGVTETATPGTYSATITSSVSGSKAITVTLGGQDIALEGNGSAVFVSGGVDPAAPGTGFGVSTGDQPVGTGRHTITVTLVDTNGNPVSGQAAGLSGSTAESLGGGSVGAFAATATAGTYTAVIASTVAGSKTVSVLFGGTPLVLAPALGGNGTASFAAGAADPSGPGTTYTVSIGDQPVGTGVHTVTVTLADEFGNVVSGQASAIAASAADPLGTGAVSAFAETATPGTYTASVTSTVAGGKAIAVTFSGAAVTPTGNTTASFLAGAPDTGSAGTAFTVTGGDVPVVTGSHLVTITLTDQYGNPVSGQAATIVATTADALGSGGITAVTETATAGTYTATVSSSVAGQKTVAVTVAGSAVGGAGNAVASFVSGGADIGNAGTTYAVSAGDQVVGAGTHTVTVTLADASGNPVSGQAEALAASTTDDLGAGAVGAFAESGTTGVYTASIASTVAGAKTITATFGAAAITLAGNGTATFVAGAPDPAGPGTAFTVSTGDQPVSTGAHTVTATVADGFGNPVSGQAAQLAATTAADLGSGVISGFAETATAGTYTATITSTIAGVKPIAVALGGTPLAGTGNTAASFAAGGVDLGDSGSAFSVTGGTVTVGSGAHTVTVRLADSHGNPVAGQADGLTATTAGSLGSGAISVFAETGEGVYQATVTSSASGEKTIAVSYHGDPVTLDGNGVASFGSGGVDVSNPGTRFTVSSGPVSVEGGSHTVTVTLTDSEGNPVSGAAAGLSAAPSQSLGSGAISAFAETATPGSYAATITSSVAGDITVAVRYGGDPLAAAGNTIAGFTAGGVDLTAPGTGYVVSTGGLPVGGAAHTITVTLSDANGNPVSGAAAQLAASASGSLGAGALTAFSESAPGVYLAQVTSTVAGAKAIAVTSGGVEVTRRGNGTATFVAGAVDPSSTTVTATSPVRADGADASVVTVSVFDRFGNPVTAIVPVTVGSTIGNVGPVVGHGDGTYTASITSTVGGTATVTATVGGSSSPGTASVAFLDVTAPTAPVLDPSDGASITGCAEPGSTIQVRDADGAVIGEAVAGPDCRFEIPFRPPLAPGDRVTVTATDPDGNVSSSVTLRVGPISMELAHATREPGQQQIATGHGFQPGESVSGLMFSTPVDLGTRIADANGDVTFTFTLAGDAETGQHTVTLTGTFSGSVSERFTVTAPPGLAATGSGLSASGFWLSALTLGLGLVLTIVTRRRRDFQKGKA